MKITIVFRAMNRLPFAFILTAMVACSLLFSPVAAFGSTGSASVTMIVQQGWNLVSLPVAPADFHATTLFPSATSQAFSYNHGYNAAAELSPGKGYWIKFAHTETLQVAGTPVGNVSIPVNSGWNLTGAMAWELAPDSILRNNVTLLAGFTGYTPGVGYQTATTLAPGKGYWIKSASSGSIQLYKRPDFNTLLISPSPGSTSYFSANFRWHNEPVAVTYRLQLAASPSFTITLIDTLLTDTAYAASLDSSSSYQCRVGIVINDSLTLWSPTNQFSLSWQPPDLSTTPYIPEPNGGATTTPKFTWRKRSYGLPYRLQVSADSTFASVLVDTVLSDTSCKPPVVLDSLHGYFWRAGLRINASNTTWAGSHKFTVRWISSAFSGQDIVILSSRGADLESLFVVTATPWFAPGTLFSTTTAGTSWDTLQNNFACAALRVHPINPGIVYASVGFAHQWDPGVLKSIDGGRTFSTADSGIFKDVEGTGFYGPVEIDPVCPETLFVGTGGIMGGWLFRSTNGGAVWTKATPDSVLYDGAGSVRIDPHNHLHVCFVDYGLAILWESFDGGVHWARNDAGFPISSLQFTPAAAGRMFAIGYNDTYTSSDGGVHWNVIARPVFVDSVHGLIGRLICDGTNAQHLVAVASVGNDRNGVAESFDGGISWVDLGWPRYIKIGGRELLLARDNGLIVPSYDGLIKLIR